MSKNIDQWLWEEKVHPGASWSHVLKRGTTLRLTDIEGGVNAGMMLYNFECPTERYNMPDTLKAQHTAKLTTGFVLYSDMGRILCSITADTVGWHDPLGGAMSSALAATRYGEGRYQELKNDYFKNGFDSFVVELGKWGMGPRDLTAVVNWFSRIDIADDGTMSLHPSNSAAGAFVELRAEMNTLVVLNTCPHPLDPSRTYAPKPLLLQARKSTPVGLDDICRMRCPENGRGFTLTERYFL